MRKPPEPLHDLTALQRDILVTVDGQPGLHIADELEEHHDRMRDTTFYDALNPLVEKGLVDKQETDGRSNAYSLTDEGHDALTRDLEWRIGQLED